MTSLRQHLLRKAQVTLTPEQRYEARMAMRGRDAHSAEDNPGGENGSRYAVYQENCPSCGHPLHGIHRVRPNGSVDERAVSYHDDANEAEEVASKKTAEAAYKSQRIQRPGSRGGHPHWDGHEWRYGDLPLGEHIKSVFLSPEGVSIPAQFMDRPPERAWTEGECWAAAYALQRWFQEHGHTAELHLLTDFDEDYPTERNPVHVVATVKDGNGQAHHFDALGRWSPRDLKSYWKPKSGKGLRVEKAGQQLVEMMEASMIEGNDDYSDKALSLLRSKDREGRAYKSMSSCPCCGDHAKCGCGEDCAHCDCNRPLKKAGVDADTKERGVMVALYPSPKVARSLAIPGGEDPKEIHLTLAYLGKIDDLTPAQVSCLKNAVKQLATKLAGFELQGRVSGLGYFQQPDSDQEVLYASVDVPGLNSVYEWLLRKCREKGLPMSGDHGFTAHMTLTYQKKGTPRPRRATPLPEVTFAPESLVCKLGAERHIFTPSDSECPDCGWEDCRCIELASYNKSLRQYVGRR